MNTSYARAVVQETGCVEVLPVVNKWRYFYTRPLRRAGRSAHLVGIAARSRRTVELGKVASLLTPTTNGRSFLSSSLATLSPSSMRSQALGGLFSRRPQGTRASTNQFRRRITRLGQSRSSASAQGHLTIRDGARESAHQTRARPQGSRGGQSDDRPDRNPMTDAPRAGYSSGALALWCSGTRDAS